MSQGQCGLERDGREQKWGCGTARSGLLVEHKQVARGRPSGVTKEAEVEASSL